MKLHIILLFQVVSFEYTSLRSLCIRAVKLRKHATSVAVRYSLTQRWAIPRLSRQIDLSG